MRSLNNTLNLKSIKNKTGEGGRRTCSNFATQVLLSIILLNNNNYNVLYVSLSRNKENTKIAVVKLQTAQEDIEKAKPIHSSAC